MTDKYLLVVLSAPGNHRGDNRRSNTTANVAHEIDQSGYTIAFFRRYSDIACHGNRNKQESNADDLDDAEPHGKPEADQEIGAIRGVVQTTRQSKPAGSNQISRLDLCREPPNDGHHQKQDQTAGGEHESGELGSVAHKRLEELRNHDKGAEQHDAHHEHHQIRGSEIQVFEEPHVNDWVLPKPFPDDERSQAYDGGDCERRDEVRSKPVVFLPFVQEHLQAANAESEHRYSDVIHTDSGAFDPSKKWRILDQSIGQVNGQNSNRDLDEKDPSPGIIVCDPSAQHRSDGRSKHGGDAVECKGQSALFRRETVVQNCLRHRLEPAAADTLDGPEQQQHWKARRESAEK